MLGVDTDDFLDLLLDAFRLRRREVDLSITLAHNNATIQVVGMDRPERIDGIAIDLIVLDEFAKMKDVVWPIHVRPCLSTPGRPPGRAIFIGKPFGGAELVRKVREVLDSASGRRALDGGS